MTPLQEIGSERVSWVARSGGGRERGGGAMRRTREQLRYATGRRRHSSRSAGEPRAAERGRQGEHGRREEQQDGRDQSDGNDDVVAAFAGVEVARDVAGPDEAGDAPPLDALEEGERREAEREGFDLEAVGDVTCRLEGGTKATLRG